jgi:hypothetical protein
MAQQRLGFGHLDEWWWLALKGGAASCRWEASDNFFESGVKGMFIVGSHGRAFPKEGKVILWRFSVSTVSNYAAAIFTGLFIWSSCLMQFHNGKIAVVGKASARLVIATCRATPPSFLGDMTPPKPEVVRLSSKCWYESHDRSVFEESSLWS